MSRRSTGDTLWKQTAQLVRRRPGWVIQAVSTPGMPTYWCFGRGTPNELLVQVDDTTILLEVPDTDEVVTLATVDELVEWLNTHRPGALQEPRKSAIDKLKAGQLFTWK